MSSRKLLLPAVLGAMVFLVACEDDDGTPAKVYDEVVGNGGDTVATQDGDSDGDPVTGTDDAGINLGSVHWLHANASGWAQTATLSSVKISGDTITLNYDKARSWPGVNVGGTAVNANPWIFVNMGGTWYAATWEWLRVGQTSKSTASVSGSHIKMSPLNAFTPVSGETYGFMVSGLARDSTRNVKERSNVLMVTWS